MKNIFKTKKKKRKSVLRVVLNASIAVMLLFFGILGYVKLGNAWSVAQTVGDLAEAAVMAPILAPLAALFYLVLAITGAIQTMIIGSIVAIAQYNNFINEPGIIEGWVIVRDLCNMFFVFILLMIAFGTILRVESYQMKKALPKLIIMAVVINFSRTICGIIIDISQVVMLSFVSVWAGGNGSEFVELASMTDFFETSLDDFGSSQIEGGWNSLNTLTAGFVGIFFMIIVGIVFIATLMVFLMRIIMIWIYVVLSPLAFLLSAFPSGKQYASQWWGDFSKNVISGPVLAFFIWLAFIMSKTSSSVITSSEVTGVCAGNSDIMCINNFLPFLISIGFLVGGIITTQKVGGIVGSVASKGMSAINKSPKSVWKGFKESSNLINRPIVNKGVNSNFVQNTLGLSKSRYGRAATVIQNESYDNYKDNNIKRLQKGMEKVVGEKGMSALLGEGIIPNRPEKERRKVDTAKRERESAVKDAHDDFNSIDLVVKAKDERDSSIKASDARRNSIIKDSEEDLAKGIIKSAEHAANKKRANDDFDYKKVSAENNYNIKVKPNMDIRNNAIKKADDKYEDDTKDISNETGRRDKHATNDADRGLKLSVAGLSQKQKDKINNDHLSKKIAIDKEHDNYYSGDGDRWRDVPGRMIIDAAKLSTKETIKGKDRVNALAGGASMLDTNKSDLVSAAGLTSAHKKFYSALLADTDESAKSITNMVKTLENLKIRQDRGDKISKGELDSALAWKQGIASLMKSGKDTSKLSPAINILNEITTGDGSDPKHTQSVEEMKATAVG